MKFFSKFFTALVLGAVSMFANAGVIYTAYTGNQNGVTIRDSDTLVQSFFFNPGFGVDNIAAGGNNDMYLTSGNVIYQYSNAGVQLNSMTFPDPAIAYQGIAYAGTSIYAAYTGSQNGVTIRDSTTLVQTALFDPGFAVDNIAAGNGNEMYLTSGNTIHRYSNTGVQLASLIFPDPGVDYQGITMAVSGNNIYTAYTGSQNGVTVRDALSLVQSFFFDPGFAVDNLVAGDNNDMFLTSGNSIYHYSDVGIQLNSFTFPDQVNYEGIAFVSVPEPSTLLLIACGVLGLRIMSRLKTPVLS